MLAPFRGVRYARDRVSGIANVTSPPYDVISGGSLANLRAADPHNVVRLILPGEGEGANQAAAALLREWLSAGVLTRDQAPGLYVYEQAGQDASWRQRGIISLVRLGPPAEAGILPHESVMPGPVAGRRTLMAATRANLEPIFLIYDGERAGAATKIIDAVADGREPLMSVSTEDGVTHRLWELTDPAELAAITGDLSGRRALIADGHHRYAAYLELQARDAGVGPRRRALGLRDGVPGRLGRLPAEPGRDPPGAAGPGARACGRAGQGGLHRPRAAHGHEPGGRARGAGRGGRPRAPRSCWPGAPRMRPAAGC